MIKDQHIAVILGMAFLGITIASTAESSSSQQQRMRRYENVLEDRISNKVSEFRSGLLQWKRERLDEENEPASPRTRRDEESEWTPPEAVRHVSEETIAALGLEELRRSFESEVTLFDSRDGKGQDVEIRLTMPLEAFMEFAPIAALTAAAVDHKFPAVYIFVREETTDRVARVAFRDAESIAARYLADDDEAIDDTKDTLLWH